MFQKKMNCFENSARQASRRDQPMPMYCVCVRYVIFDFRLSTIFVSHTPTASVPFSPYLLSRYGMSENSTAFTEEKGEWTGDVCG